MTIAPVTDFETIPDDAACQEASTLSRQTYIPCRQPTEAIVFSPRDRRAYLMCPGCASHNLSNRGARLVFQKTDHFGLAMQMEQKRQFAAEDAGPEWKASRGDLPNTEGFKFVARLMDDTEVACEVVKQDGRYTVSGAPYALIFIWRPVTEEKRRGPIAPASEHHAPRFVLLRGGSIRDEWKRTIVYQPLPGKLPRLFLDVMNEAVAAGKDVPEYEEIMQKLAERGQVQL